MGTQNALAGLKKTASIVATVLALLTTVACNSEGSGSGAPAAATAAPQQSAVQVPTGGGAFQAPPAQAGWTAITASADTRTIYVSSSEGLDTNDGLSEATPLRDIGTAKNLLRDGFPDHLLFKAGDVFSGALGGWGLSGRSEQEPMVVSTYGSGDRPVFKTGGVHGITRTGANTSVPTRYLRFIGLDFYNDTRDPQSPTFNPNFAIALGIDWLGEGENILIEDCRFRFFLTGIAMQRHSGAFLNDVQVRRCIITDNYGVGMHSQGMYMSGIDNLVIEENVLDHNGWSETVPGAHRTMFNHNMYIPTSSSNVVVRNNVASRGASHGLQLRPGGVAHNNLFFRNAIGMFAAGEWAEVTDNVVMESDDIDANNPRGWGIEVMRNAQGATYLNNILLNRLSSNTHAAVMMNQNSMPAAPAIVISGTIVADWNNSNGEAIQIASQNQADVVISGSIVDGMDENGNPVNFVEAGRTMDTYVQSLGGQGGFDAFIQAARSRGRNEWDLRWTAGAFNDYIAAGYTVIP